MLWYIIESLSFSSVTVRLLSYTHYLYTKNGFLIHAIGTLVPICPLYTPKIPWTYTYYPIQEILLSLKEVTIGSRSIHMLVHTSAWLYRSNVDMLFLLRYWAQIYGLTCYLSIKTQLHRVNEKVLCCQVYWIIPKSQFAKKSHFWDIFLLPSYLTCYNILVAYPYCIYTYNIAAMRL